MGVTQLATSRYLVTLCYPSVILPSTDIFHDDAVFATKRFAIDANTKELELLTP
jgi:hypothetical protein